MASAGNTLDPLLDVDEYDLVCRQRLQFAVPVTQPLVLISQAQRSGGTLLSQLFDGHPECHAHPHELHIGHPSSRDWPPLDLTDPQSWFDLLFERKTAIHLQGGYTKGHKKARHLQEDDVYPFLFMPGLQRSLFDRCVGDKRVERERDVLDCYFTSYFNAWLDNHNLYTGPKKAVVAFAPGLAVEAANRDSLFSAYPDGTLISIVRDPFGWYASASKHDRKRFGDLEVAIGTWRTSVEAALDAAARFGDRVVVLTYARLVQETEPTMRRIAERIGLAWSDTLLTPTFNAQPIRANSQAQVGHGVIAERATAYRDSLDEQTIGRIGDLAGDLYERAELAAA